MSIFSQTLVLQFFRRFPQPQETASIAATRIPHHPRKDWSPEKNRAS